MRRLLKLLGILLVFPSASFAQSPPQIPLAGNIGVQGSVAILGGTTVQMPSDASYTLTPAQWSNKTLVVTSATSLTATRTVVAPLNKGQEFNVENSTTGGQSITVIGASGTGVTIANGASASVFCDGTNYIQSAGTSGGGAGGVGVQYSANGTTLSAANITGPLYANGASVPTVETPIQANSSLGFSPGIIVSGDSIGAATGTSSTGVGNIPFMNGFAYLLKDPIGGLFQYDGAPGDQSIDASYKWAFRAINPQGGGLDPITVSELGTNDATYFGGTVNQQNVFNRVMLGNLLNESLPQANKMFAQSCTQTGGFAADTDTPVATMASVSTTSGSTLSCVISAPKASDTLYLVYRIRDSTAGTFTVSIDGTAQNDPYSGTTTWSTAGDGGALIISHNGVASAYAAARFTGLSAGNHTVLITVTSTTSATNAVSIQYVGAAPASSAGNPYVYAVSPNQQNATAGTPYVPTYQGFIQTVVSNLTSDGLNVFYVDTASALLNNPSCGNGNQATMFANCYNDTIHPNNTGHAVMASTILAAIPTAKKVGATTWNRVQQLQAFWQQYNTGGLLGNIVGPQAFFDVNPYNLVGSATSWAPGVKFQGSNGQMNWIGFESVTGLTFASPNGGPMSWCHNGGSGEMSGLPPTTAQCDLQYLGSGAFNFIQGSSSANGMTIQNAGLYGGTNFGFHIPGILNLTGALSGVYSTTVPTSVSTNNNSPCFNFMGGAWNGTNSTPGFSGPCLQSVAINPTPTGQIAQAYLTLQNTASVQVGLDLRNAQLTNHLGTADAANLNATALSVGGTAITAPVYVTTASLGGSALAAGACSSTTNTVSGVTGQSRVIATPMAGGPGAGFYWQAWGSGSNTITTQVCATVAGTPAAQTYYLEIHP